MLILNNIFPLSKESGVKGVQCHCVAAFLCQKILIANQISHGAGITFIIYTVIQEIFNVENCSYNNCYTKIKMFELKLINHANIHTVVYLVVTVINPRRACARVTVLVLSVCLSVCLCVFPILAPRAIRRTNSRISDFSAIRE